MTISSIPVVWIKAPTPNNLPLPNPEKDNKDSSPCSCACSGADEYGSQLKQASLGWCQGRNRETMEKPWETIGF
jgi:hypothetical protein